jgi:hypothetical protein
MSVSDVTSALRFLHSRQIVTYVVVVAVGLTLLLASFSTALGQTERLWPFTSQPVPPQQYNPWTPPDSKLPSEFVSATTKLFEQGLADPRGCEYREVTLKMVFAEGGKVKVHAWVLPVSDNNAQRFAVGWNGLVYPAISVGPTADVREDVKAAISADEELRENWKRRNPEMPFYRFRSARSAYTSLKNEYVLPLKACLLLRLGAADLAADVWAAWTAGMREGVNDDSFHLKDPYMMLATDWVWSLFDRAIEAHMVADDNLALFTARAIGPIQKAVDDEGTRRGFEKLFFGSPTYRGRRSLLWFLAPLPELLADQERRALERSRGERPAADPGATSNNKAAQIACLIQSLDQVAAPQLSQPGGIEWQTNETINALSRQGNDAVEPLLTVLESDARLTRSVSASRFFHFDRHIAGTHEAAFIVLGMIFKTYKFGPLNGFQELNTLSGRQALAAELRKYFRKYKNASLAERWYGVLADDSATPEQWEEVSRNITQFTRYDEVTQAMLPAPRMQGERLRERDGPSLSSLLLRRMLTVAGSDNQRDWPFSMQRSSSLASALAAWDGIHYLQELRQFSARLKEGYAADRSFNHDQRAYYNWAIVDLYLKRAHIPDPEALREYVGWLETVNPKEAGYYNNEFIFKPAWHFTKDPVVIEAINRLFSDGSPWVPIIGSSRQVDTSNLLPTPLLSFTAFREQVLKALEDKSVAGTLNPRAPGLDGEYELKVENSIAAAFAGSPNVSRAVMTLDRRNDPYPQQKALTPIRLRTCDVYAWKLRVIEGAPQLKVYWSEAQRDAAIAELATFLRNHKGPFVNTEWRSSDREN